ncbi:hypothetical protein CORC01_04612 [Colletotrichum orchidophilum]|uniref:Uncharacterized protein n=1 Tax=Colletotrichum orchidophilum TaxID=1209926 RepID=A0A1G4BF34_9PEZI|nr:uncharacterized protein CORC01_04612 [Colletotrichum orchidophilum]OHE99965.1 hypothetical protein CORC01_04612 [Colletotrichum orchidophilum]
MKCKSPYFGFAACLQTSVAANAACRDKKKRDDAHHSRRSLQACRRIFALSSLAPSVDAGSVCLRRAPQAPASNLAVSNPKAWCTKLIMGIRMPSLPSSPCHCLRCSRPAVTASALTLEYRSTQRPTAHASESSSPVDVISCNQPPGTRPIAVPEATKGGITSEAARGKTRTPNPSTLSNPSRHPGIRQPIREFPLCLALLPTSSFLSRFA